MSQRSICEGPPSSANRISDFALGRPLAARSKFGSPSESPTPPAAPTRKKVRRDRPSQSVDREANRRSMARSPPGNCVLYQFRVYKRFVPDTNSSARSGGSGESSALDPFHCLECDLHVEPLQGNLAVDRLKSEDSIGPRQF